MNRRRLLAVATVTISTMSLAGCSGDDSDEFEEANGDDGDGSSQDVELLSHEMVREDEGSQLESVAVVGEAENVSGGELDYAEIEVKWYSDGTLQDSFLDNINGLSGGETWAFEVEYLEFGEAAAAIDDYEIRAGTSL